MNLLKADNHGVYHGKAVTRKTKTCLLVCLLMTVGCGPRFPDNSCLTITPGVGIAGIAELGNTPQDIALHTRDLVVREFSEDIGGYGFTIPSLGARWMQETLTEQVSYIDFQLDSEFLRKHLPAENIRAFRGSINGQLDCGKKGGLTRFDIISVFGSLTKTIDLSSNVDQKYGKEFITKYVAGRSNVMAGRSVSMFFSCDHEILFYPTNGIEFHLRSNVVYGVDIVRRLHPGVLSHTPATNESLMPRR